jgi:pyruvate/2-oxoglutarate/acetoin dehydrogenase E1 component
VRELTFKDALNQAVDEEMARDPTIFLMGEDVVKWGSAYMEFEGLSKKYSGRVKDTPICESAFVGGAIGAASLGMRPIANVMYANFLGRCFDELMNQIQAPYYSGGRVKLPMTIITYAGAGYQAGASHSPAREGLLINIPGLKFVVPSTPYDVYGLVKSAIRDDNPVMVLEHQMLVLGTKKAKIPDEEFLIPLGKADVKRAGKDVTVVATMLMVHRALAAAKRLEEQGISIEVIDPRTWVPLDKETILGSIKKTGRLVTMVEEPKTGTASADLIATVAEEAFEYLKAPIKRVCAPPSNVPFGPVLEKEWMPDEDNLIAAVKEIT